MQTATAAPNGNGPEKTWDRKLTFYHPTGSGNGAAMRLEPRFNRPGEDRYNCFFLEMAMQKATQGQPADGNGQAAFDWENKLTVKLDFTDICELLPVLEGRADRAGGQRNGLFHRNGQANTIISLQKAEKGGLVFGLSRKANGNGQVSRAQIVLSDAESLGLRYVFATALFFLAFHAQITRSWNQSDKSEVA